MKKNLILVAVQLSSDNQDFDSLTPVLESRGYNVTRIKNGNTYTPPFKAHFRDLKEKEISFVNEFEKSSMLKDLTGHDLLILGNDWHPIALRWHKAAQILNIPTIVISYEGLYLNEADWYAGKCPVSDHLCIWGKDMERVFTSRGYSKDQMTITGVPRFDRYYNYSPSISKEEFFSKLGLDPNKKVCTYATQIIDDTDRPDRYRKEKIAKKEAIIEFMKVTRELDVNCLIRLHPTDMNGRDLINYVQLRKEYNPNAIIDGYREKHTRIGTVYDTIFFSDCWVALSSTTILEAVFLNKNTIVLNLSNGEDPTPYVPLGISKGVYKAEKLKLTISDSLDKPDSVDSAGLSNFLINFTPGTLDGNNCNRCADVIDKFLNN
jgi:hypothetical protein